jgi:hypothetical protein
MLRAPQREAALSTRGSLRRIDAFDWLIASNGDPTDPGLVEQSHGRLG